MVELFQKKKLQRSMKPTPLISLIRGGSGKKNKERDDVRLQSLGSGVTLPVSPSLLVTHNNDPYMPLHTNNKNVNRPERTVSMPNSYRNKENTNNSSSKHGNNNRTKRLSLASNYDDSSRFPSRSIQSRFSYCQPDIPTPCLSPTSMPDYQYYQELRYSNNYSRHSFYGGGGYIRPLTPISPQTPDSYRSPSRSKRRSSTWKPAPSISSSEEEEEEDDDDEVPLGKIGIIPEGIESLSELKKGSYTSSLLSNTNDEDGDDDLIPIGKLSNCSNQLSAAEKYKARVQARLNMGVVI